MGHYVHPLHHAAGNGAFHCTSKDMNAEIRVNSTGALIKEAEANIFASELVMPTVHLNDFLNDRDILSVENIVKLSDDLFASREALFRKISELNNLPVAAYFIKDKLVRYFVASKSFPMPNIWPNQNVPFETISSLCNVSDNTPSKILSSNASKWIRQSRGIEITEQSFVQENGYLITFLKASNK